MKTPAHAQRCLGHRRWLCLWHVRSGAEVRVAGRRREYVSVRKYAHCAHSWRINVSTINSKTSRYRSSTATIQAAYCQLLFSGLTKCSLYNICCAACWFYPSRQPTWTKKGGFCYKMFHFTTITVLYFFGLVKSFSYLGCSLYFLYRYVSIR